MSVTLNELEKKPVLPHGEWDTTEVEWATDPKAIQWTAQLHDAVKQTTHID